MSRTYKDIDPKVRDPKSRYLYGTEKVPVQHVYNGTDIIYTRSQYVDIAGAKPKRARHYKDPWIGYYSRNPSWWNHLTSHVPTRRKVRDWSSRLKLLEDIEDHNICPDFGRKPMIYFW